MAAIRSSFRFCLFGMPMKTPNKAGNVETWFKRRGYLHFDEPISLERAKRILANPLNIEQHAFHPLIGYQITSFKVRRDPKTGKLARKPKIRDIAYPSHLDSHIYSYYSALITETYERILHSKGLSEAVLAFRPLGKSNIDFAHQAFKTIRHLGNCTAICLDVSGFFNNIDHAELKNRWSELLGEDRLPSDHFAVFRSITKYSKTDRDTLYKQFGISSSKPKSHGRRICTPVEFRRRVRDGKLIKKNEEDYGISQGTPISATLSNVYMLDFDVKLNNLVKIAGGEYFRYCDDILILSPSAAHEILLNAAREEISKLKLEINENKTEIREFTLREGFQRCNKPLQYLGFTFDGSKILLRSAALAKFSQKMKSGVRLAVATAKARAAERLSHGRPVKPLFKRKLYDRYSHLGTRNFVRYGLRAAKEMKSNEIREQLKPMWGRLQDEINAQIIKRRLRQPDSDG